MSTMIVVLGLICLAVVATQALKGSFCVLSSDCDNGECCLVPFNLVTSKREVAAASWASKRRPWSARGTCQALSTEGQVCDCGCVDGLQCSLKARYPATGVRIASARIVSPSSLICTLL